MATDEKIRETIANIIERRKNVRFEEIEWVVNQLSKYFPVAQRKANHGTLFRVGTQRFMICTHHPGSKEIKAVYVHLFASAMMELGWYDD